MTQTVSVIMPVHNGEDYLEAAIESVKRQTHRDFELILIDDASSDRSTEIMRKACEDPRIKCIKNLENQGVAESRNIAIRVAKGDFIAFLDQDDEWLPDKLERQLSVFERHPELSIIYSEIITIDQHGAGKTFTGVRNDSIPVLKKTLSAKELFDSNQVPVLTVLMRRDLFALIGYFDRSLPGVDDYDLWLRASLHAKIGFIDEVLARYRVHAAQQSRHGYRMLMLRIKTLEKFLAAASNAGVAPDEQDVRVKMQRLYRDAGNYCFHIENDYAHAHEYYRKYLKIAPRDPEIRLKAFYCSLPSPLRQMLKKLIGSVKRKAT
jgi:glycosyltransferase involved in cell wall biosynthesis